MTRQLSLLALISFALVAPFQLPAQNSDQIPSPAVMQAVEDAFPQELRYTKPPYAGAETDPNYYNTSAAVFSRNADGMPSLISAAYNGDGAEIAMLAYSQGKANIVSAITNEQYALGDGECDLQMVNLADPEHPDSPLAKTIDATFHGGPDWFFIWDGQRFQSVTRLQAVMGAWHGKEVPDSDIYSARIVDIDRSGPVQILADNVAPDKFPQADGISSTGTKELYRYNGRTYAPVQTILFIGGYVPNLPKTPNEQAKYAYGTPPWTFHIAMHQTPEPSYKLFIVNGDRDGSNRVTSAEVDVNGVTIILPAEVNQSVETLTRTVQLQKENKIKVTVDGPANSHLYVVVE